MAVVAVVVAVVGIAATSDDATNSTGGSSTVQASPASPASDLSPSDTVAAYLEALKSGDAAKALSYGATQPASTALLTDEVLRKQIAKMPITNVRILDEDKSLAVIRQSTVRVSVTFGQVVDNATIDLKKGADQVWKLETAVAKIDPPFGTEKGSAKESVSVFGKDFKNGSLYVFPGYLDIGSSNDNLTATAEPVLLEGLRTFTSTNLDPEINLSDSGRRAITDQLAADFANCQGSNLLKPPNCPAEVGFTDAVDGTVTWGVADLSGVKIGNLSPVGMYVPVGGRAAIPLGYRTTSGGTKQGIATAYTVGTADVSKTPPEISLH